MSREIRFTKQYKPTGFGYGPDPGTVEAHRHATEEAAETRQYNRTMKSLLPSERNGKVDCCRSWCASWVSSPRSHADIRPG
jgi:hypothetical protein